MRIAQVAPLYESVPPKLYGGTERVVSYLTESLVQRGHDVTLFASGDSSTKAELVPVCLQALRLDNCQEPLAYHIYSLETVARMAHHFDLIHFHCDYLSFPYGRRLRVPHVSTLHGRLDIPDLLPLYQEFHEIPLISISDAQRKPFPNANWISTVYHGLPNDLYKFTETPSRYLSFVGRISPEKRVDRAIKLAIRTEIPIKIAAKIDKTDEEYYLAKIKPLMKHSLVEYVGEISEEEKSRFLGNSLAMLFLVNWPEPFGLAMIEALACGTPVIAAHCGSVPEIIEHGVSGFIVDSFSQAIEAINRIESISRFKCRRAFERRFSIDRMVQDYERAYQKLVTTEKRGPHISAA